MCWWLFTLLGLSCAPDLQPCCGPITPQGHQLEQFLDSSDVDHLWRAGWHVDWQTGAVNREEPGGPEARTHCSAFVAAMADRVHIYVLRPPQHKQELLANAQMRWLRDQGVAAGWQPIASAAAAQSAANRGELVLRRSRTPTRTGPATSPSCIPAGRRAPNWITTGRRKPRPASRMPSASRRPRDSATMSAHGRPVAAVLCAITRMR